ncbi:MAG TPA: DUF3658 domain-containing protein [Candidatus Nanoarchaeia archaeon]|nr:DUF3658 domain-containing protein [Candidatus Nanoarchaeia archaeon]
MTIHVVFGNSASGNLRQFLRQNKNLNGEIIVFLDNLSIGPINDLSYKKRIKFHEDILQGDEDVEEFAKQFNDSANFKRLSKINQIVYIWVGPNSFDELGFLKICNSSDLKMQEIFLIKFPKIKVKARNGKYYFANSLGELSSDKTNTLLKYKRKLSKEQIQFYSQLWEERSKDKYILRIRSSEFEFKSRKESYFDNKILNLCTQNYQSSAKIIGEILAKSKIKPDLRFLIWRIKELIKNNKLVPNGNISSIRDLKIKKL